MSAKRKRQRWVVKAGSQAVCDGGPLLIRAWMQDVETLLKSHHVEVIWVTSGAIASGVDRTNFPKNKKRTLHDKQALSAIGQPMLINLYNEALQATGRLGAQILLTSADMRDRKRHDSLVATLNRLLSWGITPILNENDATADEEIRFGDNDSLSARVASMMKADRLVILTDVDGLFDADPKKYPDARPVHRLDRVTAKLKAKVRPGAGSTRGTGGMLSKLLAAEAANRQGIETWLARGDLPKALLKIAKDELVGTRIGKRGRKAR